MSFDIQGKTALVTGANRGIGRAIVESCIQHGATKVYAAVRNPSSVASLVETHGDLIVPLHLDLGQPETITAAAQTARDVHLVVNNAGIFHVATPLDATAIETLQSQMDINVFGQIRMAQAFAPILKANGGGAFVQLNSIASLKCFADVATYSASKAASYAITQALRELLGKQGTTVLSVHPGPIATDMSDAAGLSAVAEPPSLVGDGIIAALKTGTFHLFPDTMAKQIGSAYQSFAENIVEADLSGG